jgi:DNA-binding transcriptional regulator YiaG
MPNIASVMKGEILRLARKEVRKEIESLKNAAAQFRSDIASLKRTVAGLERLVARHEKSSPREMKPLDGSGDASGVRFSAKGFASHRKRLGLSASEMGALLGVSAQTVYHWESGKTKPRKQQVVAVASLRKMGKRQAREFLAKS